nr:ATP-dependent zinc metalloprotease FtsH [Candidatus Ozemobacteraceae bacterium]
LIDTSYQKSRDILTSMKADLERISLILLQRETISGAELKDLLDGKELPPLRSEPPKPETPAAPTPTEPAETTSWPGTTDSESPEPAR